MKGLSKGGIEVTGPSDAKLRTLAFAVILGK
jgi:hypothetical protein